MTLSFITTRRLILPLSLITVLLSVALLRFYPLSPSLLRPSFFPLTPRLLNTTVFNAMTSNTTAHSRKLPTLYLSHGGGPCFFMDIPDPDGIMHDLDKNSATTAWYRQLSKQLKLEPADQTGTVKAIVIVSAHWETHGAIHITSQQQHSKLLYDYYGFPAHTYELQYNPPGNVELSKKIQSLLQGAGIEALLDEKRNFDHGVFVPLLLIYPQANIPVVQVSIDHSLDPAKHIAIGKALSSLRSQGCLIIGSGQTTHSFRGLQASDAKQFVTALHKALTELHPEEREAALLKWQQFPAARKAHPKEEHLIPLHVVVGAAGQDKAERLYSYTTKVGSFSLDSWKFE